MATNEPFYFRNGKTARSVIEFMQVCYEYPHDAAYHLINGHIEPWFNYVGRPELARIASAALLLNAPNFDDQAIRLTWFLENLCFERKVSGSGLKYFLHFPIREKGLEKLPTILFLHGSAEKGTELSGIKSQALPDIISKNPDFPFLTLMPQCTLNSNWQNQFQNLRSLVEEACKLYPIDPGRIYLTGISMGGAGAWKLAAQYPELFAALVPCCGYGDPLWANRLKEIPTWIFHGARDPLVPVHNSENMFDALKELRGNVRLTIYPQAEHDCWTETYNNPGLYQWLLEQHLPR